MLQMMHDCVRDLNNKLGEISVNEEIEQPPEVHTKAMDSSKRKWQAMILYIIINVFNECQACKCTLFSEYFNVEVSLDYCARLHDCCFFHNYTVFVSLLSMTPGGEHVSEK